MLFSMELPLAGDTSATVGTKAIVRAAEDAGFSMLGYTDHPAPSAKWLESGGHPTFDPFAGLAFVAALTRQVRLMTYLAVLPYRNPFLTAKSIATVDRLSDGRFTLVAGCGYLRSEFAALGQNFDSRNDMFEAAIEVIRSVFVDDEFTFDGDGYSAHGVIHRPRPVQLPHPPIWIGGTSRASRRRVARFGTGWSPLVLPESMARSVRSASLSTDSSIAEAIDDLFELTIAEGRDPTAISIQLDGAIEMGSNPNQTLERCGRLAEIGVTHLVVRPPDAPIQQIVETVLRFGEEVIGPS